MDASSPTPKQAATRTGSALVEITCPTWCEVSTEEHACRLWENEGRCVHQVLVSIADPRGKTVADHETRYCPAIEVALYMTTNPLGREVEPADVLINGQESNLEQLAALADAVDELASLYRGTPGRC